MERSLAGNWNHRHCPVTRGVYSGTTLAFPWVGERLRACLARERPPQPPLTVLGASRVDTFQPVFKADAAAWTAAGLAGIAWCAVAMAAITDSGDPMRDGRCDRCGGCDRVQTTCVSRSNEKEVTKVCWDYRCEQVCIPGPSIFCGTLCQRNDCGCWACWLWTADLRGGHHQAGARQERGSAEGAGRGVEGRGALLPMPARDGRPPLARDARQRLPAMPWPAPRVTAAASLHRSEDRSRPRRS
jgi:hypothetical protein